MVSTTAPKRVKMVVAGGRPYGFSQSPHELPPSPASTTGTRGLLDDEIFTDTPSPHPPESPSLAMRDTCDDVFEGSGWETHDSPPPGQLPTGDDPAPPGLEPLPEDDNAEVTGDATGYVLPVSSHLRQLPSVPEGAAMIAAENSQTNFDPSQPPTPRSVPDAEDELPGPPVDSGNGLGLGLVGSKVDISKASATPQDQEEQGRRHATRVVPSLGTPADAMEQHPMVLPMRHVYKHYDQLLGGGFRGAGGVGILSLEEAPQHQAQQELVQLFAAPHGPRFWPPQRLDESFAFGPTYKDALNEKKKVARQRAESKGDDSAPLPMFPIDDLGNSSANTRRLVSRSRRPVKRSVTPVVPKRQWGKGIDTAIYGEGNGQEVDPVSDPVLSILTDKAILPTVQEEPGEASSVTPPPNPPGAFTTETEAALARIEISENSNLFEVQEKAKQIREMHGESPLAEWEGPVKTPTDMHADWMQRAVSTAMTSTPASVMSRPMTIEDIGVVTVESLFAAAKSGACEVVAQIISDDAEWLNARDVNGMSLLETAIIDHDHVLLNTLLMYGANIHDVGPREACPLHIAVAVQNSHAVSELLLRGADVNVLSGGLSTLHTAATNTHNLMAKLLISKGAVVDSTDIHGFAPLHYAAAYGSLELVDILLKNGASKTALSRSGEYPFDVAMKHGHTDVAPLLAVSGDDDRRLRFVLQSSKPLIHSVVAMCTPEQLQQALKNATEEQVEESLSLLNENQEAPLHLGARLGKGEHVSLLLTFKAPLEQPGPSGARAIHLAARGGHSAVVDLLTRAGATIDPIDDAESSPLHSACASAHAPVTGQLIKLGADVNMKDVNGWTPLHHAASVGAVDCARLLLEADADANTMDNHHRTPLDIATEYEQVNMAWFISRWQQSTAAAARQELLASLEASTLHNAIIQGDLVLLHTAMNNQAINLNQPDNNDHTPLSVAARLGRIKFVKALVNAGASVDKANSIGMTALHYAAANGRSDVAAALHAVGAELETRTRNGQTALALACLNAHPETVNFLLLAGASVEAKDNKGDTPLHCTAHSGARGCAVALLSAGASPEDRNDMGQRPVEVAYKSSSFAIVNLLEMWRGQEDFANKEYGDFDRPETLNLHLAVQNRNRMAVLMMLRRNVNVLRRDKNNQTALHIAARLGLGEIAQFLIQSGAKVNVESNKGITPMHMACASGHAGIVGVLLQAGANVDAVAAKGLRPLHLACGNNHSLVATQLIHAGVDVNAADHRRYTALHYAAEAGGLDLIRALLAANADPQLLTINLKTAHDAAVDAFHSNCATLLDTHMSREKPNPRGVNFARLHEAVHRSEIETLQVLLDQGADVNSRDTGENTPLHIAARMNHLTEARLLLAYGASLEAATQYSYVTPLHLAAANGHAALVQEFVDCNADVNRPTRTLSQAIHLAAGCGSAAATRILLKNGADPSAKNARGYTPLHFACEAGSKDCVMLLISAGARMDEVNEDGLTAYQIAVNYQHTSVAAFLRERTARRAEPIKEAVAAFHRSPLHTCVRRNNTRLLRSLLIRKEAPVGERDGQKDTALHIAAKEGRVEIATLLLKFGANLDAQGYNGRTPMHVAVIHGKVPIINLLGRAGANVNARADRGWTPLHFAVDAASIPTTRALIYRGADPTIPADNGIDARRLAQKANLEEIEILLSAIGSNMKGEGTKLVRKLEKEGQAKGRSTHTMSTKAKRQAGEEARAAAEEGMKKRGGKKGSQGTSNSLHPTGEAMYNSRGRKVPQAIMRSLSKPSISRVKEPGLIGRSVSHANLGREAKRERKLARFAMRRLDSGLGDYDSQSESTVDVGTEGGSDTESPARTPLSNRRGGKPPIPTRQSSNVGKQSGAGPRRITKQHSVVSSKKKSESAKALPVTSEEEEGDAPPSGRTPRASVGETAPDHSVSESDTSDEQTDKQRRKGNAPAGRSGRRRRRVQFFDRERQRKKRMYKMALLEGDLAAMEEKTFKGLLDSITYALQPELEVKLTKARRKVTVQARNRIQSQVRLGITSEQAQAQIKAAAAYEAEAKRRARLRAARRRKKKKRLQLQKERTEGAQFQARSSARSRKHSASDASSSSLSPSLYSDAETEESESAKDPILQEVLPLPAIAIELANTKLLDLEIRKTDDAFTRTRKIRLIQVRQRVLRAPAERRKTRGADDLSVSSYSYYSSSSSEEEEETSSAGAQAGQGSKNLGALGSDGSDSGEAVPPNPNQVLLDRVSSKPDLEKMTTILRPRTQGGKRASDVTEASRQRLNYVLQSVKGEFLKPPGPTKVDGKKKDKEEADESDPMNVDFAWEACHRRVLHLLISGQLRTVFRTLNEFLSFYPTCVEARRTRANLYYHHSMTDEALRDYNELIDNDEGDHMSYFRRAVMFEMKAKYVLAMSDYTDSIAAFPTSQAYIRRAKCHVYNGDQRLAHDDYTKATEVDNDCLEAYRMRGLISAKMGLFDDALSDFSHVIRLDPDDAKAYYLRGNLERSIDPQQALNDLSISLLLEPKNHQARHSRGVLYHSLGDDRAALHDYETAIKLQPDHVASYVNAALIFMETPGRLAEAILYCQNAIKLNPHSARAYFCLAEAYRRSGRRESTLRTYGRLIHMFPSDPRPFEYRARCLMELRRQDEAVHDLIWYIKLSPQDEQTKTRLGQLYSHRGDYKRAQRLFMESIRHHAMPETYHQLGMCHQLAGNWPAAEAAFAQAARLQTPGQAQARHLMEKAYCAQKMGGFDSAADQYTAMIKKYRMSGAYHQRAICRTMSSAKKAMANALSDFDKAVELDPSLVDAFIDRAALHQGAGRVNLALSDYERASQLDPNSIIPYINRGVLLSGLKEYKAAIVDFQRVVRLDPSSLLGYYNLGIVSLTLGRLDDATQALSTLLLLNDQVAAAWRTRGYTYLQQGDLEAAAHDYSRAVELAPTHVATYVARGYCLYQLGRWAEARDVFAVAISLDPRSIPALIAKGNCCQELAAKCKHRAEVTRHLREAARSYSVAVHLDPTDARAHSNLAQVMQRLGKSLESWQHYTAALHIQPTSTGALEGRGRLALQTHNLLGAFVDLTRAIPGATHKEQAEILVNRGVVNQMMKHTKTAVSDLERAIEMDSECMPAYFNLGNMHLKSGLWKKAAKYYTDGLKIAPEDSALLINRGIARIHLTQHDDALDDLSRAISHKPHVLAARVNRGYLLTKMGRFEDADADMAKVATLLRERKRKVTKEDVAALAKHFAMLGNIKRSRADTDSALSNFAAALALDDTINLNATQNLDQEVVREVVKYGGDYERHR